MCENKKSFRQMVAIIGVFWSCLAAQAGEFAGGLGTPEDPYQIATAQQLASVLGPPRWPRNHFILVNDIDLDPNLPGGRVFDGAVIASGAAPWREPFGGHFDGAGHTIRNMVIRIEDRSDPSLSTAGLFGRIHQNAVVRDLKIEAADVRVFDRRAGILAGENAGRVVNCQVSGRISSGFVLQKKDEMDEVGGLVGRNMGDIIDCRADTDWVCGHRLAGGLVGENFSPGTITGCRATCSQVSALKHQGGGLVGGNSGVILDSYALGEILAPDSSFMHGGLAGTNRGTISGCHADSDIVAGVRCSQLGSLVGENWGAIANCYARGSIAVQNQSYLIGGLIGWNLLPGSVANSYATGKISVGADSRYVGGLVGDDTGGDVHGSLWDVEATGVGVSAAGEGSTTEQMQQADTFLGWDFVDTWTICEGQDYPRLRWEAVPCE